MLDFLFGAAFTPNKCKTQLRLCVSRIKLLQNKKQVTIRQHRKDIAQLLASGKEDSARIRVEALIQEQNTALAYEILELYCELLSVRVEIIKLNKSLPEDMQESVASVLYAAQRCSAQLPELLAVKEQLQAKYGKEYVKRAITDESAIDEKVNPRLIDFLAIKVPNPKAKLALLSEIAVEHNVDWEVVTVDDDDKGAEDNGAASSGGDLGGSGGGGGGGGGHPQYPRINMDAAEAAADPYPKIQFSDVAGDAPPPRIAVGTPVHRGDTPSPQAPHPQEKPQQSGDVSEEGIPSSKVAPATAPPQVDGGSASSSSDPKGKGKLESAPSAGSDDHLDLPDTPSPLNLNLRLHSFHGPSEDASAGGEGSSGKGGKKGGSGGGHGGGDDEGSSGGMDDLAKRLDALKTGAQLPKPPKDL